MKNKKAISLIVLVITVIVMIILASAIILSLSNTGIIDRAEEAVQKTNEAQVNQIAQLAWAEAYADGVRTVEDTEDKKGFSTIVEEALASNGITGAEREKYEVTVTTNGVRVVQPVISQVNDVPIPKGFVASKAKGENTVAGGLVIYEGTTPVTDENVEVAKRTRNQYVWVPVSKENFVTEFVRKFSTTLANSENADMRVFEVILDTTTNMPIKGDYERISDETVEEAIKMYESVAKYGGFYIGRYEAGIETVRNSDSGSNIEKNIYSMLNKYPYVNINYVGYDFDESQGAIGVARSVYKADNTNYGVVSTLTYGVQYDAVLQWYLNTGVISAVDDETNNIKIGNHMPRAIAANELNEGAEYSLVTSMYSKLSFTSVAEKTKDASTAWLLTTGALKAAKLNNIYDIAGNVGEYTMEKTWELGMYDEGEHGFASRGASYYESFAEGTVGILGKRDQYYSIYGGNVTGFRVALYVK